MADQGGISKEEALAQRSSTVRREFESLIIRSRLTTNYQEIGEIDQMLIDLPIQLDDMRSRGYVHNRQLKNTLELLVREWRVARPHIERMIKARIQQLESSFENAQSRVTKMKATNESSIAAAETAVNILESQIESAETAIKAQYEGIETRLGASKYQLAQVSEMMDWVDSSDAITLREAEGPLQAVEAEWQTNGKNDGLDGILLLTDQRLLFEQREEIVTKKKFGLFKSESKQIQELHLELEINDITEVSHKEEGGFLGMGKADILELVLTALAPISRARFHLKGEESSNWAELLKHVISREIDQDRAVEYVDEVKIVETIATAFPETCPACFAQVPPQPRGILTVNCEFCGVTITPTIPAI